MEIQLQENRNNKELILVSNDTLISSNFFRNIKVINIEFQCFFN
jgi:hypothetical protein